MLFAWESTGLFFSAKAEVARHRRRRVQSHAGDSGVKYVPKIINRGTGKIPMNGGFGLTGKYSCLIRGRLVISMATWPHDVRFQFSGRV